MPHFAHADEQLLYSLATQILRSQFVDTRDVRAALAEWGEADLVDIIGCGIKIFVEITVAACR